VRGFAALFAALAVAALSFTGSASAAPVATVLVSFNGAYGYGETPYGGLISDAAGDLFGTTTGGGGTNGYCCFGTVFEIPKTSTGYGTLITLVSFNGANGAGPYDGLISDAAGDLFGTTTGGGGVAYSVGTVFEIPKTSTGYGTPITLVSFNGANGAYPYAGLISQRRGRRSLRHDDD
jgi:hypothetical protein